jgi:maleylpyruvate isomerase
MKLYNYFITSASYRVRIALALKGIDYEYCSVNIRKGEQHAPAYRDINPQGLVPVLEDGGRRLHQSLAIIEYLDEVYPDPPLLPHDPVERNRVRSLAMIVAAEIHPLNNVRVLKYLTEVLQVTEAQKLAWYAHWVSTGFAALERRLAEEPGTGRFCHGDRPTLADIALVPQVSNARRFAVDLTPYPTIVRIDATCRELPAFQRAEPAVQPDAE